MSEAPPTTRRTLPRGRNALDPEVVASDRRDRLLEAMAQLVVEHGFVDLRVSDLIARAGVAKPTFYELYESKLGCFLALIDRVFEDLTTTIAGALDPGGSMELRVGQGMAALLDYVGANENHSRVLFLEAPAAGRASLERVDRGFDLLAGFYVALREEARTVDPSLGVMSQLRAVAIVSAISGIVSTELRRESPVRRELLLDELVGAVLALAGS